MRSVQVKSVMLFLASVLILNLCTLKTIRAQYSLGLKGTVNLSNYIGMTNGHVGAEAGIFMRMGKKVYCQPEVNYVFRSSKFKKIDNLVSSNMDLKQQFISVPVLLGYHFVNKENIKLHFTIGPRFDFKINDNIIGSDWEAGSLQWGGQVGLGIDLWRFTLDASYCIAADNFHNTVSTTTQTRMSSDFMFSIGFKILK